MPNSSLSFRFILILGFVSLCSDITYEGARSILGPYLGFLGANALAISVVAGFGEFLTYTLRLVSGYWVDKTKKYFFITYIGYALNLLAVPCLAFVSNWYWAAGLIFLERAGKAIRVPSRDAMLAHAGNKIGVGWGFGVHQAIDRIGAMLGPLLVAWIIYYQSSYRFAFTVLLIPAIFALFILFFAHNLYQKILVQAKSSPKTQIFQVNKQGFYTYILASSLIGAGYADFPLIAYHLQTNHILSSVEIPIAYAISVGLSSLSAPFLGYFFDKVGGITLILSSVLGGIFAPLVFLGDFKFALIGIVIWSIGIASQASLMRAVIATLIPSSELGFAYGLFNTCFGFFWFLGSAIMGALYLYSVNSLVIFSVVMQVIALIILYISLSRS